MNAANYSAQFRSLGRILPLVAMALALAGPSRLWGQSCQQGIQSVTISPGSIVALASGAQGTANGTVTLNCPSLYQGTILGISDNSNGVLSCGQPTVPAGQSSGPFSCSAVQGSGTFTLTISLNSATATTSLAVIPLEETGDRSLVILVFPPERSFEE
jgi:hypothetical protein